jgi:hypothetical protein
MDMLIKFDFIPIQSSYPHGSWWISRVSLTGWGAGTELWSNSMGSSAPDDRSMVKRREEMGMRLDEMSKMRT